MGHRIVCCWITLAALVGCGVTEPIDELVVTVSLSDAAIAAGDTTEIVVRAANPTRHEIEFESNSCDLVFQVVDASEQEVYPGMVPCFDILLINQVAPGDYLERTYQFDGRGRMEVEGGVEDYPLPPGRYHVRGSLTSKHRSPSPWVELDVVAPGGG